MRRENTFKNFVNNSNGRGHGYGYGYSRNPEMCKRQQDRERMEDIIKKEKKEEEERKMKEVLDITSYPELCNPIVSTPFHISIEKPSFLDKLNTDVVEEVKNDVDGIQPGWVKLERKNGKIVKTYGPEVKKQVKAKKNISKNADIDETKIYDFFVMTENRRIDMINHIGIDEYERLFVFSNYDYEYFDKLDAENETDSDNSLDSEIEAELDLIL